MKPEPKPIIVKKSVKHIFAPAEIATLNVDFGNAFDAVKSAEADFDAVKAVHKAKITEAESRMTTLRATINAGFEFRIKELRCTFRPADKKKDFWLEVPNEDKSIPPELKLILTEDMTPEDFQQDLIQAESIFGKQKLIPLWDAGDDHGKMIVGQLGDRWFSALRGNVGAVKLEERLDSEQQAFKDRKQAIQRAAKRCEDWLLATLGKDAVAGFKNALRQAVEAEEGKVE